MNKKGGSVSDAFKQAGTNVAVGFADTVGATGKIMSATADTAVGVTENLGKVATSGTQIVSSTVGTIATTTQRMENSTKEMAKRRAYIEQSKTAAQEGKSKEQIAQIEAQTKKELLEIQNNYEIEQARLKLEQEYNLDKLNSEQREKLLNQRDATNNRQTAYNFGFTNNNPKPTDIGFKQSINFLKNWKRNMCFSYIPQYFVTNDGKEINISFPKPEEQPTSTRLQFIQAINNDTGKYIEIRFQAIAQTDTSGKPKKDSSGNTIYLQLPVIKFQDSDGQSKILFGKMYYNLIWFPCGTKMGGKRRRTNKRRTNRRRTNKRTNRSRRR